MTFPLRARGRHGDWFLLPCGHHTSADLHEHPLGFPMRWCPECDRWVEDWGMPPTRFKATAVISEREEYVPRHYNISLGCEVKDKHHLTDLQQEHGCEDYQPSPEAEARLKHGAAKVMHDARNQ